MTKISTPPVNPQPTAKEPMPSRIATLIVTDAVQTAHGTSPCICCGRLTTEANRATHPCFFED